MDEIRIKNLRAKGQLGVDHWQNLKPQTLIFNITAFSAFKRSDSIADTVSYSTISHHVQAYAEQQITHHSLESLASKLALDCLDFGLQSISLQIEKTHALLHAESVGIEIHRSIKDLDFLKSYSTGVISSLLIPTREDISTPSKLKSTISDPDSLQDTLFIKNLQLNCIIGVNTCERIEKQRVIINISLLFTPHPSRMSIDYVLLTKNVSSFIEKSEYRLIEMMAEDVCDLILYQSTLQVDKVQIRIEKPSALMFAETSGVQITRHRSKSGPANPIFKSNVEERVILDSKIEEHVAYLAIGTNLGDRVKHIEDALLLLDTHAIRIIDTSFLYETAPVYVMDQPRFLNAALKVKTTKSPIELLATLKVIESELGRDFESLRNGPRVIDLDILFYDRVVMNTHDLKIPHPAMKERFFVLEPLKDIAFDFVHPIHHQSINHLLKLLRKADIKQETIHKIYPIRHKTWDFNERTFVMGILNVTPDSFSDGGRSYNINDAVKNAVEMIDLKADIIDIGGQSTAPNTLEVTEEEEIERVVPVIKAIRAVNPTIPISVDTFRAGVAEAAIQAGADMINDVSGGSRDPRMLHTMTVNHIPVCLMHMRGNSSTMMSMTSYKGDLMTAIREELALGVDNAIKAGVYRWNILVDPGIGFAKNSRQNYEILYRLDRLTAPETTLSGMPVLVAVSRKKFIGISTGRDDPIDRVWGSAAATTAAIIGGASIVRVHDVKEMKDVCLVADECRPNRMLT